VVFAFIGLNIWHGVKRSIIPLDNLARVGSQELTQFFGQFISASVLVIAQGQVWVCDAVVNAGGFLCFA